MIGYVTLGTKDMAKAAAFYDAIAAELETPRMMEYETFIAWGKPDGGAGIGLTKPFDGNEATVGNGVMVALQAKDKDQVQRLYDTIAYKQRWGIEAFFAKLKQYRRIATRYDKLAQNFLGFIKLASIMLWLK